MESMQRRQEGISQTKLQTRPPRYSFFFPILATSRISVSFTLKFNKFLKYTLAQANKYNLLAGALLSKLAAMVVPLVSLFYNFFLFVILSSSNVNAQTSSTDTDFSCSLNSSFSCDTYVSYRARQPYYFDVGSISDLLEVSRLSIAKATGLASEDTELFPDQILLVPVKCFCNSSQYFSNVTYQIKKGDSFYSVSIGAFENLTNYHVVQDMNPTLDPTNLTVGAEAVFPLFCKCPTQSDLEMGLQYLVTYVWQPWDDILPVSNMFGASAADILAANNYRNFTAAICSPVLIPVKLPTILQSYPSSASRRKSKHEWILITVLSIMGLLAVFSFCLFVYMRLLDEKRRANLARNSSILETSDLFHTKKASEGEIMDHKNIQDKLLPGVSGYIGKPIIYDLKIIMEATLDLSEKYRIGGSVYKATLNDQVVAVKKTKQASEELTILQKLHHGNLVKLEGISSDDHENSYLVYEYAENGSLDQWLFPGSSSTSSASGSVVSLGWSQRLHVALDVANALQYLHEHTQPSIVHGDIRTCSILLDSRFKAKIAGFSTARHATNSMMLKVDVFAFGLVLLELLSGKKAMESKDYNDETLIMCKEINEILEIENNREEKFKRWMDPMLNFYPVDDALNLAALAKVCTSEKSAERPKMTDIVFNLCFLAQSSFEMYGRSWTSGEAEEIVQIVSPLIAR
ncbi:serine/threonine receptor-like kinase NFP [Solanum dulcamara]|uniref:serine/threonine receptor-like kinase NFP n=1 Tax=Solanum dulcamara TaxID=45834 RepID=UPI00248634A6|nr:serine/threonine receptor-like kinase NFP [Solanum dulcamara]